MKEIFNRRIWLALVMVAVFLALPHLAFAAGPTVLVVPTDPLNPTFPHNTYTVCSDGTIPNYTTTPPSCILPATLTESTITLGATVPSASGSTDMFTVTWVFGDASPNTVLGPFAGTATAAPYAYDISTAHQYPSSAAVGTAWIATVTVKDTTTSASTTTNYYVIQEQDTLNARVNVAIDRGLWYMHVTMWRTNSPANGQTLNWGGWDGQSGSPGCTVEGCYDYAGQGSQDAANVQAFEVSGHLQNGPATDPYTDDVARGMARALTFLTATAVPTTSSDGSVDAFGIAAVTYTYNPATANYTCADGVTIPTTTNPVCASPGGGQHFYNPGATSCTTPPCTISYDANHNGLMDYSSDGSGEYTYTTSPFLDMLVASGTPSAVAPTGSAGIKGATFLTIVQDVEDFYGFSQYGGDCDVSTGYPRGNGDSCTGGAWLYSPQQGDDDSTSQWGAIAFLSGHAFGISIPPSIADFNNVWVTNAQDVASGKPTGVDSFVSGDNYGAYGYRGNFTNSNEWGPFAVTPSGMVQMAMDGVGRTKNTVFGDASTDFDQRWNNTETYYADNFCNSTGGGPYYAPREYMYGLFSFTKSMLLAVPTSNQFLRTQTPGVFSNPADPPNSMDWYAGLSAANGGADPCDGVAQTLVQYQNAQAPNDGEWYGHSYYGSQWSYETAWAIIMLRRTVFVSCINNLAGRGTPGNILAKARIDLTWSAQTNATNYAVFRGPMSGGPYTQVGTSTLDDFSDRTAGLVNGDTYYYVVQPINGTSEICQSNEAKVTIP